MPKIMGKKQLLDFSAENVGNEAFLIIRVFRERGENQCFLMARRIH